MHVDVIILFVGLLIFVAHLFTDLFRRTRIPDVFLLIVIGLALGPLLGIMSPEQFGAVGPVFTTVTLVIILFEGGLELRLGILLKSLRSTLVLAVATFTVSVCAVAAGSMALLGFEPQTAFVLGAIVGSTSPAVIVPLIGQMKRMERQSKTILFLESVVSDVLSIVVTFALLEALRLGQLRPGVVAGQIIASLLLAAVIGAGAGLLWCVLWNRIRRVENTIVTMLAYVFVVFGVVESLGYSGYIAALAVGVLLGNSEALEQPSINQYLKTEPMKLNKYETTFLGELVFLVKTFFFVYLGLSIRLTDAWLAASALALSTAMFFLRIPVVRLALPRQTPAFDASIMAIMVPKGLAAAVLASIPLREGLPHGEAIQTVTYSIVLLTIVLTSLLTFLMDKAPLKSVYGAIFSGFRTGADPALAEPAAGEETAGADAH